MFVEGCSSSICFQTQSQSANDRCRSSLPSSLDKSRDFASWRLCIITATQLCNRETPDVSVCVPIACRPQSQGSRDRSLSCLPSSFACLRTLFYVEIMRDQHATQSCNRGGSALSVRISNIISQIPQAQPGLPSSQLACFPRFCHLEILRNQHSAQPWNRGWSGLSVSVVENLQMKRCYVTAEEELKKNALCKKRHQSYHPSIPSPIENSRGIPITVIVVCALVRSVSSSLPVPCCAEKSPSYSSSSSSSQ